MPRLLASPQRWGIVMSGGRALGAFERHARVTTALLLGGVDLAGRCHRRTLGASRQAPSSVLSFGKGSERRHWLMMRGHAAAREFCDEAGQRLSWRAVRAKMPADREAPGHLPASPDGGRHGPSSPPRVRGTSRSHAVRSPPLRPFRAGSLGGVLLCDPRWVLSGAEAMKVRKSAHRVVLSPLVAIAVLHGRHFEPGHVKAAAGNWSPMTEPASKAQPVNPGEEPGVDPPPDDGEDAVDRAERLDEPEPEERPDPLTWVGSDVP
jgi:hypothetical protein